MTKNNDFTPMIPFMPKDPLYYHAYVPYQIDIEEFDIEEALNRGSLFVCLYSTFSGDTQGDEVLC